MSFAARNEILRTTFQSVYTIDRVTVIPSGENQPRFQDLQPPEIYFWNRNSTYLSLRQTIIQATVVVRKLYGFMQNASFELFGGGDIENIAPKKEIPEQVLMLSYETSNVNEGESPLEVQESSVGVVLASLRLKVLEFVYPYLSNHFLRRDLITKIRVEVDLEQYEKTTVDAALALSTESDNIGLNKDLVVFDEVNSDSHDSMGDKIGLVLMGKFISVMTDGSCKNREVADTSRTWRLEEGIPVVTGKKFDVQYCLVHIASSSIVANEGIFSTRTYEMRYSGLMTGDPIATITVDSKVVEN